MRNTQCVLTSTNVDYVRKIVGTDSHVYEFIGKPYDLQQILAATQRALADESL